MTENVNENFLSYEWWKTATVDDVKAEIKKGADVNAKDVFDVTALMVAASGNKNPEIIRTLVELGADVNAKGGGMNVLMYAARYNENPEIIRTLVELGADVNAKDYDGWTALMYAARDNENPEIIRALVELGAEDIGCSSLALAEYNNNPEVLKILDKLTF